jgi:hypothetical protein
MAVQNIRIRYIVDRTEIDAADASIKKLSASEQKLKTDFDNVNSSAQKSFKTIDDGSNNSNKNLNNLNGTLKSVGTAVLAAFALDSVVSFGKKVIELTSQFQKYEAVLTNSLGSQKEARAQLALLTEEAIRSNFSLSELTSGYIKLVNQGFKPTVNELRALQDLSNFTGKSFDQLIEAVLDAQQDQFIRLKDFGIKAKKEGEQVTFTFKEQSTVVKNTASDIRNYLVGLGKLEEVQGTTAAISSTLNGRLSNLGDNFDKLFVTLGQGTSGPLNSFIDAVNFSIDAITRLIKGAKQVKEELNLAEIGKASETVQSSVDRVAKSFEKLGITAQEAQTRAVATVKQTIQQSLDANSKLLDDVKAKFKTSLVGFPPEYFDNLREDGVRIQALIDLDQAQLDALNKISEKKEEVAKTSQKDLDKEYNKQLAIITLQEQNALRLEELARSKKADSAPTDESKAEIQKDVTEKLSIQTDYNEKRVSLFKKYNQQNLAELKSYNIRFEELDRERLEYLRGQEEAYTNNLSKEDQARFEIEQEYLASVEKARQAEYDAENKRILDLVDAQLKAEKEAEAKRRLQQQTIRRAAQELYQGLSNLSQQYFSNQQVKIQNEQTQNEQARQDELKSVGDNKQAQATINAKYDQMQRKLNREAAQSQKDAAIFQIGIYTAEAVVKALASAPPPANFALAAVVGALGAVQLALAESKPLPKYATGVERLSGDGTETSDSILARLSVGERVVTARDNHDYYPALTAIHNHHIPPDLLNNFVLNYDTVQRPSNVYVNDNSQVVNEVKSMSKKLDKLKQVTVTIDKQGVHAYIESEYSRTEIANNYITK